VENQTEEMKAAYTYTVRNSNGIKSYFGTYKCVGSVFEGVSSYNANAIAGAISDKIFSVIAPLFYRRRKFTLQCRASMSKRAHKRPEARAGRFADILVIGKSIGMPLTAEGAIEYSPRTASARSRPMLSPTAPRPTRLTLLARKRS
jgi:hypothetical protein